ncbi:MAG: ATP-binding cassette domain-containing protein [Actinomycetota bacterium]
MLELDRVTKRYGDLVALDEASFSVTPGRICGLLGPNGAGKTTAMRAVLGLLQVTTGTIAWHGRPLDRTTRLTFGYLPEQRGLYPKMKVAEQVAYFGELHAMRRRDARRAADELLELVGLTDRRDDFVEALSHGNQQRVQLAVALVHSPVLLILDEPFSGLDPLGVEAMSEALTRIADDGAAVLLSSHQLDLVEDVCEDVAMLSGGRVVGSGSVGELRAADGGASLTVELAAPPDDGWRLPPGVEVIEEDGLLVRFRLADDGDARSVLASLGERRTISFRFEPTSLAEVFRQAVTP